MLDLSYLTEEEQRAILKVLKRDADLKQKEEDRCKILKKEVEDEKKLKVLTGEWFYEVKGKRHDDRLHGSDLVRASMRKGKSAPRPGGEALPLRLRTPVKSAVKWGGDARPPPEPAEQNGAGDVSGVKRRPAVKLSGSLDSLIDESEDGAGPRGILKHSSMSSSDSSLDTPPKSRLTKAISDVHLTPEVMHEKSKSANEDSQGSTEDLEGRHVRFNSNIQQVEVETDFNSPGYTGEGNLDNSDESNSSEEEEEDEEEDKETEENTLKNAGTSSTNPFMNDEMAGDDLFKDFGMDDPAYKSNPFTNQFVEEPEHDLPSLNRHLKTAASDDFWAEDAELELPQSLDPAVSQRQPKVNNKSEDLLDDDSENEISSLKFASMQKQPKYAVSNLKDGTNENQLPSLKSTSVQMQPKIARSADLLAEDDENELPYSEPAGLRKPAKPDMKDDTGSTVQERQKGKSLDATAEKASDSAFPPKADSHKDSTKSGSRKSSKHSVSSPTDESNSRVMDWLLQSEDVQRDSDHNKPAELLVDVKSKASPSSTKMDTKSRGDGDVTVKTAKAGKTDPFELKFTGVHAQNRDSDGNKPAELLADVKQKPSPDGVKLEAKNKDDGVLTAKKTKVGKTDVGKLKPNHAETDAQPGDSDHNIKDIKHTGPSDDVKMGLKNKHGDSNAEKTKLEKSRKNASDNSMFMDVDTFTQPDESTDGEPADATNKNKFVISSSKAASSAKLHGETIFPDKQRLSVKDMKDHWEKANRSDKGNITTATAAGYVKDHLNVSDSDTAINDGAEESGATASVEKNDAKLFSREKISPEKSRMNIDEAAYQVEQSKQPKPKCSSESVDLSTPAKPMSAGEKEGVEPGKESGRPGRASLQRQTSSESEASSAGDGPDGSFKIFSGRQRMKDGSQELHGRSTKFKDLHDFWTKDTKERKKVKGDLYDEEDRKPKSPTGAPSPQSRAEQGKQQNTSSDRPESESGRQGELSREPSKSQKEAEKQLVEKAVPAEQETSVSPDKTRVKSGPRTKTELPAKIGAELSLKNVVLSPNTDERQRLEERAQELEEQDPGVQLKPQKTVESSQTTTANRAKTEKKPMAKEPSERVRLPFGTEAKPDVKERIQDLFESSSPTQTEPEDVPKKAKVTDKPVSEKPFQSLKIPLEVEARREFKMKVQELVKNDPPVVEPRKEKTSAKPVVEKKQVSQRKDEDVLDFDSSEQEPEEEQPTASPPTQVKDVLKDSDNTYNKKHPDRPQDLNKRDPFAEAEQEVELEQSHSPPVEASDLFLKMKDLPKGRRLPDKTRQDPEDNSEKHNIQLLKGRPHELARINSDDDSFEKPSKIQSKDVRDAPPQPPRRPVEKRKEKAAMPPKSSDEETLPQRAKEQVKHGHKAADPRALSEEDKEPPSPVPEKRRPKEPSSADVTVAQNRPQGRQKSLPETTDQEATWSDDPEIGQMNRKEEISGSMMSLYSDAGDYGNVDVKGEVNFALKYDDRRSELHVCVAQCRDLAAAVAKKGRSDPYVKTYLLPDKSRQSKKKTGIRKNNLNPVYNEILKYKIPARELQSRVLNLSVWHNDKFGKNSFLGEVEMELSTWDWGNTAYNWFDLQPRVHISQEDLTSRGYLNLALKFIPANSVGQFTPASGEIHIWVKEAKNLLPLKPHGVDAFVKCYILPDLSRKSRQKTRTVKKSMNPVFNHTMVYDGFQDEDMHEACVELTVWDQETFSNQFLGGLRLGLGGGMSYGKPVDWMDSREGEVAVWHNMITRPGEWTEALLPLRPDMVKSKAKK
ncbi:unnamed protein product [Lampetra fluviatilis]